MKLTLPSLVLFPLILAANVALADDLNIRLDVSGEVAPGVYGHVSIGDRHPSIVYEEPIIVHETRETREPIYLHVPPEHARHWERYCDHYHACDRRVYFVRSSEYRDFKDDKRRVHEERREEREDGHREHEHDHGRGHGHDHEDDRDEGHESHGHGHAYGHDHDDND